MSDTNAADQAADEAGASAARDEAETDRFAAQLKQDARSWTARDNDASDRAADALALSVKQVKAAATVARKRAKAAPKAAPAPESTKDRPFSMSYEGVTNAQYIAGRIARGAR
jgi:hypothetical protein